MEPAVHRLYGLSLTSALPLPEVPLAEGSAPVDVRIDLGAIAPGPLAGARQIGPFLWVGPRRMRLEVAGVGVFLVEDGATITIDPAPGADDDSLRLFLLGSALGAVLYQRGAYLMHGNAIEIDGRCMVCVGASGAGKSTLAAALAARGLRVLADDVVPVTPQGAAIPGFPRIKLWRDSADKLGQAVDGLTRVRPGLEKFSVPLTPAGETPVPIRWIYALAPMTAQTGIDIVPLHGLARFAPLRNNAYRPAFAEPMGLAAAHLRQTAALSAQVHLARVRRPVAGFALDALVDALLADMRANA